MFMLYCYHRISGQFQCPTLSWYSTLAGLSKTIQSLIMMGIPGNLSTTAKVQTNTSGTESELLIKTSHPSTPMQRLLGLCQTINQIFNSISIKLNEKIFTLQVSDDGFLYLLIATLIISSRFKNISREYAGVSFINERK